METLTWEKVLDWINKPFLQLGDTPITLGSVLTAGFIFCLFLVVSFILRRWVLGRVIRRWNISHSIGYSIKRVVHYSLLTLGLVFAIQTAGFSLSSLTVILGFLSVGIGFGLKNITSNFMSGVILLFERPISVGDMVKVDDQNDSIVGKVDAIGMRSTTINTLDNVNVIVPNSQFIEQKVVNWSHGDPKVRIHVPIGVAYGSDTQKVTELLLHVGDQHPKVLKDPKPEVYFTEFDNSSLNFELLVWIQNPAQRFRVKSELNYAIDAAFRENNIQIPFPQRDVHIKMTPAIETLAKK